jgi:hypothetical protein
MLACSRNTVAFRIKTDFWSCRTSYFFIPKNSSPLPETASVVSVHIHITPSSFSPHRHLPFNTSQALSKHPNYQTTKNYRKDTQTTKSSKDRPACASLQKPSSPAAATSMTSSTAAPRMRLPVLTAVLLYTQQRSALTSISSWRSETGCVLNAAPSCTEERTLPLPASSGASCGEPHRLTNPISPMGNSLSQK